MILKEHSFSIKPLRTNKSFMKRSTHFQGILTILLLISLLSCPRNNESYIIGLNQNIHLNDFEYSVTKPYLMVRGGILMGDVFDKTRFRKMKVKLF
jgi:hypothetical protein